MIENLKTLDSYQSERSEIFSTPQALLWFVRVNKEELFNREILRKVLNKKLVDSVAMDAFVLEVGSRRKEAA